MENYVIQVKVGKGISTYRFDSKDRAMEIIERLVADGEDFNANFDYE